MYESHWVFVNVDVENKIFYVEKKNFCPMCKEAKEAFIEELRLYRTALLNGYQIQEKNIQLKISQNIDVKSMHSSRL